LEKNEKENKKKEVERVVGRSHQEKSTEVGPEREMVMVD